MSLPTRICCLLSLLSGLVACDSSNPVDSSVVEGTEFRGALHLLDEVAILGAELPWTDVLGDHVMGPVIWMKGETLQPEAWAPLEADPGYERAESQFRPPLRGGPFLHPAGGAITREGLTLADEGMELPGPEQILVKADELIRAVGPANPPLSLSYPASAEPITSRLARLTGDRVEPTLVRMKDATRRAAMAPTPIRLSYQVSLPPSASLELGVAISMPALRRHSDGISLVPLDKEGTWVGVELEEESGEVHLLWEQNFAPRKSLRYHDVSVDLGPWSGELVRLHFRAEPLEQASSRDEHPMVAWAEPVIVGEERDPRPNLLVILLDTLRADRLGCYGNERGLTPNLDALAARGVLFEDSMSAASWTLPSHASLFTSTYASQHGVWRDQVLPGSLSTIAENLRAAGYRTAAYTEGGFMNTAHGFARGHSIHDSKARDSSLTFGLARDWIRERRTPYYAFVHTYQVHSPHEPPSPYRERFVREYTGDLPEVVDTPNYQWGRKLPIPKGEDARYVSDLYDAEVAYVDAQVGLLLEELEAAGALENTLILVTSDHGEEFFEHGGATHGFSLYQEQLHVPLILCWPGHFEGGLRLEHQVHSVDVGPTLLAAAGVKVPDTFVGQELAVEGREDVRPMFVPMKTYFRSKPQRSGERAVSLREGDLKYIAFPTDMRPGDDHPEALLFDLAQDPGEQRNLLDAGGAQAWQRKVDALFERYPEVGDTGVAEYDEATQEELKKLGYVGEGD